MPSSIRTSQSLNFARLSAVALRIPQRRQTRAQQAPPRESAAPSADQNHSLLPPTRCYGSPRMTAELRALGIDCAENRVARIMRLNDLRARPRRPFRGRRLPSPITRLILRPICYRSRLSFSSGCSARQRHHFHSTTEGASVAPSVSFSQRFPQSTFSKPKSPSKLINNPSALTAFTFFG
jgi:hypothetical protein